MAEAKVVSIGGMQCRDGYSFRWNKDGRGRWKLVTYDGEYVGTYDDLNELQRGIDGYIAQQESGSN